MKRLIVNADDFGLTPGVNRAIAGCHAHGVVTSTTLMATGAALRDAIELSRTLPRLSVGCHVVLVDGEPLLPPDKVRSLLAPGTNRFYHSIGEFARAALGGQFREEEIEAEASAQMARLRGAGVVLSHFDAHKHTHMFPVVLRALLRAAKNAGVPAVRNPFESAGSMRFASVFGNTKLFVRWAEVRVLSGFRAQFVRRVREAGLATTGGCIGVAVTGMLGTGILTEMLERLPEGTWELCCHPGYNDAALAAVRTKLRASRVVELQTLFDPRLRDVAARLGIELQSFRELGPSPTAG